MLILSAFARGQNSSLAIGVRHLPNDVGGNAMVEVTFTNTSKHDLFFPCSDVSRLKIFVNKDDGTPAEDTEEGAKLKEQQLNPRGSKSVCVGNDMTPGQSLTFKKNIANFYKVSTPGTYHLKMEMDVPGDSTAKSPQIDLVIKDGGVN